MMDHTVSAEMQSIGSHIEMTIKNVFLSASISLNSQPENFTQKDQLKCMRHFYDQTERYGNIMKSFLSC